MSPYQGWYKSSFSSYSQGCVSVMYAEGRAYVRDDKQIGGPVLVFDLIEDWEVFLLGLRNGEFDL